MILFPDLWLQAGFTSNMFLTVCRYSPVCQNLNAYRVRIIFDGHFAVPGQVGNDLFLTKNALSGNIPRHMTIQKFIYFF